MKKPTRTYSYSSKEETKTFALPIGLSTHFEFFFNGFDIPVELAESYHSGYIQKQNKFPDIDCLDRKIEEIISDFEAKFVEETKQKVILYSMEYDDRRMDHCLNFAYAVAIKIDVTEKGQVSSRYFTENLRRGNWENFSEKLLNVLNTSSIFHHTDFNEMLWTPEREIWFESMAKGIDALAKQIRTGLGTKAEVLARKIDQGGLNNLLLNGGGGKCNTPS